MRYLIVSIHIIFAAFLSSCQDIVDVKVNEGTPALVIDGWVTTEEKPYVVKILRTGPYFENANTPRVHGALVIIKDNEGQADTLKENVYGEYVTEAARKGKIGNIYTLYVTVDGENYMATSEIKRIPIIDSLIFKYEDKLGTEDDGYYPYYNGPELEGQGDYYRFRITRDDKLINTPESVWNVTSDEWVDGNYIGNLKVSDEPLKKGEKFKVELMSITRDAYYFFTELAIQVNNGGMFANPPANVRTNVINLNPASGKRAVGYFGASAIEFKEEIVK